MNWLEEIKERLKSAPLLQETLHGYHTAPITEVKESVVGSIQDSIAKNIEHDGGHPWCWIQLADGRKICELGCGPNSEANMFFFGNAPTDISNLIKSLEKAMDALQFYAERDPVLGLKYYQVAREALQSIRNNSQNPPSEDSSKK